MTQVINGITLTRQTTLQLDIIQWGREVRENGLTPSPIPANVSMGRRRAMIKWVWATLASTKLERGY